MMGALLRQTAATIKEWSADGTLANKLAEQMSFQIGHFPKESEKKSWSNSLSELSQVLTQSGLGQLSVLLEYQLPYSSKRIDAVLVGCNPKSKQPVIIAVELKQWTDAGTFDGLNDVVQIAAYGKNPILHPAVQVRQYCEYLNDFNRFAADANSKVFGVAYLHNWLSNRNQAIDQIIPSDSSMLFLGSEKGKFSEFLTKNISTENTESICDDFLSAKIAPTKQLMDLAADEIRNREQFKLLDEQQVHEGVLSESAHRLLLLHVLRVVIAQWHLASLVDVHSCEPQ